MSGAFFGSLLSGGFTLPESLINRGGPLPSLQGAPPQFHAGTHAHINDRDRLLGDLAPYVYGPHPSLIGSQTQNNIPNKKQLTISRIFLPAAQADAAVAEVLFVLSIYTVRSIECLCALTAGSCPRAHPERRRHRVQPAHARGTLRSVQTRELRCLRDALLSRR